MEGESQILEKTSLLFPAFALISIWCIAFIFLMKLVFESEEHRLRKFSALLASSILCYYLFLKNLLSDYFIKLNSWFSNFIILCIFILLSFGFGIFLGWLLSKTRKDSTVFIGITSFYLGVLIVSFCKSNFSVTPFSEFTLFPLFGMLVYHAYIYSSDKDNKNKK